MKSRNRTKPDKRSPSYECSWSREGEEGEEKREEGSDEGRRR